MKDSDHCPLTNLPHNNFHRGMEISYDVIIDKKTYSITLCRKCFDKQKPEVKTHIVVGLLLNNKLQELTEKTVHWGESNEGFDLQKELSQALYPRTFREKSENIMKELFELQVFEGSKISMSQIPSYRWMYWYLQRF